MIAVPSPKQLQYFVAVATTGSFTKAAKQCFVSQSTLSAGIQELEQVLGAPLFERQGRKTNLSALGEELLDDAQNILDQLQAMSHKGSQSSQPLSGSLRMGVIPSISTYVLPKL